MRRDELGRWVGVAAAVLALVVAVLEACPDPEWASVGPRSRPEQTPALAGVAPASVSETPPDHATTEGTCP